MKQLILFFVFVFMMLPTQGRAASQDACAIWICLPGGFPTGCSGAYSEFKHRIKKGRSPLPRLSSCTVDGKTDGRYELGFEKYEGCNEGFVLRESYDRREASCYKEDCAPEYDTGFQPSRGYRQCEKYTAELRIKKRFIKMWVNGEYLGQFFYQ